ncbi:MAG: SPASM domain-containing protein, partial [Pseudomonadales bacterium]|nr:SPASM domain-containing protein [Pseudomonadales bacterium]
LGFYTNLITSGVGLNKARVLDLKEAGLDHIQLSFQGTDVETTKVFAGADVFAQKLEIAKTIKNAGYPMVLNFVLHRGNIEQTAAMLSLAVELEADYVELANTQYYGWAYKNRDFLLPAQSQIEKAKKVTDEFREVHKTIKVYFVVPDYFSKRPKACAGGWGSHMISVTPDGYVLPCQNAAVLPFAELPSIHNQHLSEIWQASELFNAFRGDKWMQAPCASCDERVLDKGGCRCQAFMLTGNPFATDPACDKSPDHAMITSSLIASSVQTLSSSPILRNSLNSKTYIRESTGEHSR